MIRRLVTPRVTPLEIWNKPFQQGILADFLSAEKYFSLGQEACEKIIIDFLAEDPFHSLLDIKEIHFIVPPHKDFISATLKKENCYWHQVDHLFFVKILHQLDEQIGIKVDVVVDIGQSGIKWFSPSQGLQFLSRPDSISRIFNPEEELFCLIDQKINYEQSCFDFLDWFSLLKLQGKRFIIGLPCEIDERLNLGLNTYLGMKNGHFIERLVEVMGTNDVFFMNDAELLAMGISLCKGAGIVVTLGSGVGGAHIQWS